MNHRPTPTFANVAEDRAADMTSVMLSRYLVKTTQIPLKNYNANRVYPQNFLNRLCDYFRLQQEVHEADIGNTMLVSVERLDSIHDN